MGPRPLPVSIVGGGKGGGESDEEEKSKAKGKGGGWSWKATLNEVAFITDQAIGRTKAIYAALDDYQLTENQRWRKILKTAVPLGETALDLYDLGTARTKEMQKVTESHQVAVPDFRRDLALAQSEALHVGPMLAARQAHAQVLAGATAVQMPYINRSTGVGERQYQEALRLLPLQRAQVQASRDAAEATLRREAAEKAYNKVVHDGLPLLTDKARIDKKIRESEDPNSPAEYQSGPKRMELLLERSRINQEIEARERLRSAAAERVDQAKVQEAEAKKGTKLADVAIQREKANILEWKADTAAGSAERLAGLGVGGRAEAEQYLAMVKAQPQLLTVDPIFAQKAGQIDPEYVRKEMQRLGEQLPTYGRQVEAGMPSFPLGAGETIEGTRKRANETRNRAEELQLKAQQDAANAMAASGKEVAAVIVGAIKAGFKAIKDEVENQFKVQRGAQ